MKKYTSLILTLIISTYTFAGKPVMNNFSLFERSHVRVSTKGLFADKNNFTINLAEFDGNNFCFPLPQGKVISPYGGKRRHTGQDIKTRANDTIRSAFDGVVRMAKYYGGYGNLIVVRHENGLESVYSHNSKNFVQSGDVVRAGDAIALTGRTGRATTEHLHFEFRIDGQPFNPSLIIDTKNYKLKKVTLLCSKVGSGVKIKQISTKQ